MFPGIKATKIATVVASVIAATTASAAPQDVLPFGTFESGTNTVVRPTQTNPQYKFLWHEYTDVRSGYTEITRDAARFGSYGIKNTVTNVESGPALSQLQFYPRTETSYLYAREFSETKPWKLNTYNRLRFWIKVPPDTSVRAVDQTNFHFGTYIRATTADDASAESSNGHFYHYYNIPYTGEWHQVIVDWHPSHQRTASGSTEHGTMQYPTGEAGYNYFDLMTRFYMQVNGTATSYPQVIMVDGFEFYREDADENVNEVYSVHGTYRKSDNTLLVGWLRDKTQNDAVHEVRYAYSDIHTLGWNNATPAPNGVNRVGGWTGYNGVRYSTTAIDFSGRSQVYVAIKPQNSTRFRQIVIPLTTSAVEQSPPSPPPAAQGQAL